MHDSRSKDMSDVEPAAEGRSSRTVARMVAILLLVAALAVEGYYVASLQRTVERQKEEIKNISLQLQTLKSERMELRDTLSVMDQTRGGSQNGNTAVR